MSKTGVGIDVSKARLDVAWSYSNRFMQFSNTRAGWKKLKCALGDSSDGLRIVLEATGGYEQGVLDYLTERGYWVSRVNARQARRFAEGLGLLAKTDKIDARMLAEMAAIVRSLVRYRPPSAEHRELGAWVRRREQVKDQLQRAKQQLAGLDSPDLRRWARNEIKALQREMTRIDGGIKAQLDALPVSEQMQLLKGVGTGLCSALLGLLPEIGHVNRRQIAKLVGIAPLNRDSGTKRGYRSVWGGRALVRAILYMATLTAIRWEPALKETYQRLRANGKAAKVAIVACMRKLLVILNARARDYYASQSIMETA